MKAFTKRIGLTVAVLGLVAVAAGQAEAGLLLSGGGSGGIAAGGSNNMVHGFEFAVGTQALNVTRLGIFDRRESSAGTGLFESHQVGLWELGGTLLASVTVSAGTSAPLESGFRMADLAGPITLNAGQSYILAAHFQTSYFTNSLADLFINNSTSQMNSIMSGAATFVQGRFGSGFTMPTAPFSGSGFVGPNLDFEVAAAVPEPSTLAGGLLGVALAGGAWLKRRRKVA